MKKLTAVMAMLLCTAGGLMAFSGQYVSVKGAYEASKQEYSEGARSINIFDAKGPALGLSYGAYFGESLRAEINYNYKDLKDTKTLANTGIPFDSGSTIKTAQHTFLANVFYYPFGRIIISPFVGAGAGYGIVKDKTYGLPTKGNFAYAVYLGADYPLTEKFAIDLTASYNAILNPYDYPGYKNINNFGGGLGLRYSF
ncbi:MAG: outer membrane beta-barrel protein [Elusimicrobiota bacterium]|jgi:opacity protein-like surface antigen|nr:outer membrane beta-barrel protein [Elusimicrobiota bacterium]